MAVIRRFGSTKAACPAGKRLEATPRRSAQATPNQYTTSDTSATVPTISASSAAINTTASTARVSQKPGR